MIKLDSALPPQTLPSASILDPKPARRLMILIPDIEWDYTILMRYAWDLAHALECGILFLGLCTEVSEEPRLRRIMVTMSALLQDDRVFAEVKTEIGRNWVKAVQANWQPGDLIVCFADQHTGLMHKPLGQILESKLNTTVYILTGPGVSEHPHRAARHSALFLWLGLVATIASFFLLQVRIDQDLYGSAKTIVLLLTVLIEFWLIGTLNNLFN